MGPVGSDADPDAEVAGARHAWHPARSWSDVDAVESVRDAGGVVARHSAARPAARGLGRRAPTAGDRGRGAGRRDPWRRCETPGTALVEAGRVTGRRAARPCTTRALLDVPEHGATSAGSRVRTRDLVGQDRVVPYLFPTPAMTAGLPARPAAAVHAEAGRFGYDTMTLVGPGTWEAARAAVDCALDGRRAGGAGEPDGVRAVPAAGPPRDPGRLRRLLLPQQRGRRRRGAASRRCRAGRRSSTSTPTTATAPRRSSTSAATCSTGRCTSTREPAGSRTSSGTPTRPARATAQEPPATCRWRPGTGDDGWLAAVRRPRRRGRATACDALVVSLGVDAAARRPGEPAAGHRDGYRAGRRAARRHRAPGGGRAGGRLPPADAGWPGRGVPRRPHRALDKHPCHAHDGLKDAGTATSFAPPHARTRRETWETSGRSAARSSSSRFRRSRRGSRTGVGRSRSPNRSRLDSDAGTPRPGPTWCRAGSAATASSSCATTGSTPWCTRSSAPGTGSWSEPPAAASGDHPAPAADCRCGLYGWYLPGSATVALGRANAVVAIRGAASWVTAASGRPRRTSTPSSCRPPSAGTLGRLAAPGPCSRRAIPAPSCTTPRGGC